MHSQRTGLRVAALLFALFAIAHVVRLLKQIHVTIASFPVPFALSWVAFVVAAALSMWMWRLSTR